MTRFVKMLTFLAVGMEIVLTRKSVKRQKNSKNANLDNLFHFVRMPLGVEKNLTWLAASRFLFSYWILLLLFCRCYSYDAYHSLDEESHLLSEGDIDKVGKKSLYTSQDTVRGNSFAFLFVKCVRIGSLISVLLSEESVHRLRTQSTQGGGGNGAVVRALASLLCSPSLIQGRCHMCVEFVVGSHLAPRTFLRVFWFSFLHKNQHFQIPIRSR